MIKLVGRSPGVYPPGTLDALKQRRALISPEPPRRSGDGGHSNVSAHKQHPGAAIDPDQMRRAHEHKLAMLRAHTPQSAPEPGNTCLGPALSAIPVDRMSVTARNGPARLILRRKRVSLQG